MLASRWIARLQTLWLVTAVAALPLTTLTYLDDAGRLEPRSSRIPPARRGDIPARRANDGKAVRLAVSTRAVAPPDAG